MIIALSERKNQFRQHFRQHIRWLWFAVLFALSPVVFSQAPVFTSAQAPGGTQSVFYNHLVTVTSLTTVGFTAGGLPPGLSISPIDDTRAVISGVPTTIGTFFGDIVASNQDGTTLQPFSITISAPIPPQITSPPPGNGSVGVPYTHTVTAIGTPIINFAASGLPPGLSLDSTTGVISGTPTTLGTYSGDIIARNGFLPNAVQPFNIAIGGIPPRITGGSPGGGMVVLRVGDRFTFTVTATGTGPFTFAATCLPPGITINPQTGVIAGQATAAGNFTGSVTVSNNFPPAASLPCSFTVQPTAVTVNLTSTPNPAIFGQPVSLTATVSGGISVPQGSITFFAGNNQLATVNLANGTANFTVRSLTIGTQALTAVYSGDAIHAATRSEVVEEYIIKGVLLQTPRLSLTAETAQSDAWIDLRAQVLNDAVVSATPSGRVFFFAEDLLLGSAMLNQAGEAHFAAAAGWANYSAIYGGDTVFSAGVSASTTNLLDIASQTPLFISTATGVSTVYAAGCTLDLGRDLGRLIDVRALPNALRSLPNESVFPHDALELSLRDCPSSAITLTWLLPMTLPTTAELWRYGVSNANPQPHWRRIPASIESNRITLRLFDGGEGDDDLDSDGKIASLFGVLIKPPQPR